MTIKQFSQNDPQWKNTLLGFDKTSTIGGYGCLLTAFTMAATQYGATDLTPATLNDKMKAIGGFQPGTSFIVGELLGKVVPGYSVDYQPAQDQPAPMAQIDAALAANRPVIAELDWSPAPGLQTHYLVLYAKSGADYLAYDPYRYPTSGGQISLSKSKYAQVAGSTDPARIITGVFFTSLGPPPAPAPAPAAPKLDTGVYASFPVYATADMQALRSQPVVADNNLLNRYALDTQFKVLESDSAANSKIGQQNQWLAVKAPDGVQGYTAAWLLSKTKSTAAASAAPAPAGPTSSTKPSSTAGTPVVKTAVDGLKLRSRPDFTDQTVIATYPLGTLLKTLEPLATVQSKVGTVYQWLQVVGPDGKQGVVAAWYVTFVTS